MLPSAPKIPHIFSLGERKPNVGSPILIPVMLPCSWLFSTNQAINTTKSVTHLNLDIQTIPSTCEVPYMCNQIVAMFNNKLNTDQSLYYHQLWPFPWQIYTAASQHQKSNWSTLTFFKSKTKKTYIESFWLQTKNFKRIWWDDKYQLCTYLPLR